MDDEIASIRKALLERENEHTKAALTEIESMNLSQAEILKRSK